VSDSARPFPAAGALTRYCLAAFKNTFESEDNQIVDQASANVLRTAAHVFLLEAAPALRGNTIDIVLSIHQNKCNTEYSDNLLAFAGRKVYNAALAEQFVC
ncbi:MAG: hypothetical protein ABSE84_28505, partial [Isosphaeraceae bacterium]